MTSSLTPAVDTADSLHASTNLPTDPFAGLDGTDAASLLR
jgi:hypothetical protein